MDDEQKALLMIAIMAAQCDQQQSEAERQAIVNTVAGAGPEFDAALRAVRAGEVRLDALARALLTPEKKRLAFAVATAVCNADGASNPAETEFLSSLSGSLGLGAEAATMQREASELASVPVTGAVGTATPSVIPAGANSAELDKMIFDAAVLNGALELLPETLASMAILPLQLRLVNRIGKAYNYDLGREHIRDFIAALGVGLTAQYVEGFARKLLGGLLGGMGRQAASSGMAFVSTYAIGQVARRYYAGGRKLEALQLKDTYQSMLGEARFLLGKAQTQIQSQLVSIRSRGLKDIVS
jgi:uncharacterized protein (DUF697 family)/tellurite resistance protein